MKNNVHGQIIFKKLWDLETSSTEQFVNLIKDFVKESFNKELDFENCDIQKLISNRENKEINIYLKHKGKETPTTIKRLIIKTQGIVITGFENTEEQRFHKYITI